jgi:hydrogenase maturation protease
MKSGQEVLDDRGCRDEIRDKAEAPATPALIIAYGNPLRNDDGLAWSVADALERKLGPASVEIVRLQQLAPELAEKVCRFQTIIFIDGGATAATVGRAMCT